MSADRMTLPRDCEFVDVSASVPGTLEVAGPLHSFVVEELLPGLGIDAGQFWRLLDSILERTSAKIARLLQTRIEMQADIDTWHQVRIGQPHDADAYAAFLKRIGYIVPQGPNFKISPGAMDAEVCSVAGPQLVVPLKNARYALNAANARWGSLYDALYGSDAIPRDAIPGAPEAPGGVYDACRGARVVAAARRALDAAVPLAAGFSHTSATAYCVVDGFLTVTLQDARVVALADPSQLVGFCGTSVECPTHLLFARHGLHIIVVLDRATAVGASDTAGVSDIILESAVTTIADCEDSVAAVDADDKTEIYRNWLGLMRGTLTATFSKSGQVRTRRLAPDWAFESVTGGASFSLPGRSLLLIRHVGHALYTDAVRFHGECANEGVVDALVTTTCALYDVRAAAAPASRNSRVGAVYAVKPKMHGPTEVTLTCEIFALIEAGLALPHGTIKLGVMDEERRTSVNLKVRARGALRGIMAARTQECIRAAADRLCFVNTGFLDRTGDELHTSMHAGPALRKADLRTAPWIVAYERMNVECALVCGLGGVAQIGKGMWARPDAMAEMLATKGAHPRAGASTAWVPSPTAATLHAMHYHDVDVAEVQACILAAISGAPASDRSTSQADLLRIPLLPPDGLTDGEIDAELEGHCQSILGYVSRWVEAGVGCSKVPDRAGVGLMEDRATLRIAAQAVANWMVHGLITRSRVLAALTRMAALVDAQNAGESGYTPMCPAVGASPAFRAAVELVFTAAAAPSGYTEGVLFRRRREVKACCTGGDGR